MLRAENISYRIGKKSILERVSAEFRPGEFTMILGPNGSGKSTFLKICSGDIRDNEGIISYHEKKIRSIKNEALAKYRAVMSQQPELSFPLTVDEVVMMGRYPHFNFNPTKKDESICGEVMQRMNLQSFSDRNYLTLSGGEKQRVQFARVLAQVWEPPGNGLRYLFLDEPLASLDIKYQQEFLNIATEFSKSNTVLIAVLHDINLALAFATRIIFMKEGKIVHEANSPREVSSAVIKKVFDVDTNIIQPGSNQSPVVIY